MVVVISFYMKLALYYNGGDDYALMNVNGFEIDCSAVLWIFWMSLQHILTFFLNFKHVQQNR